MKVPLVALAVLFLGLFLPFAGIDSLSADTELFGEEIEFEAIDGGSISLISLIGPIKSILICVALLACIVLSATGPERPDWPLFVLSGIALIALVPTALAMVVGVVIGSAVPDGFNFDVGLKIGGYLVPLALAALVVSPIRAVILEDSGR